MKLLAIDMGNTSTHFVRIERGRYRDILRLPTPELGPKENLKKIRRILKIEKVETCLLASVVPVKERFLFNFLKTQPGLQTYRMGKDIPIPIVNRYKNPRQVGMDRLLAALAAFNQLKKACIVVDFGTAITFDAVSAKGEYLGGVIAPGIELSLEALFQKTALLPNIRLDHPKNKLGRDTIESIRIGCSCGIGGLCDRIIETLRSTTLPQAPVIATGGYAAFMRRYCRSIRAVDPYLIIKGIELAYKNFLTKK